MTTGSQRDPEDMRASAKTRGRQLMRRRRSRTQATAAIGLATAVAIVGLVLAFGPRSSVSTLRHIGPGSTPSSSVPKPSTFPSALLPKADSFDQISVANGALLLSGYLTSNASSSNPTCVLAPVNSQTLDIGATMETNCDNPAISGETVSVANGYIPETMNVTISISHVDPQTGGVSVGPVVMTYQQVSDTAPVMAYGGGWLWIYDVATISNPEAPANSTTPTKAELLQVSETTGQVVNTVVMPKLYRPILAANDVGVWLGNSIEGSPADALYFVAPGSESPDVAIASPTTPICWLLGSGDDLWIGAGTRMGGCGTQTIERLDGDNFQPVFAVPDEGYHPLTVIGDEEQGLWTMQWTNLPLHGTAPSPQEIVYIDPDTGAERVVADLPTRTVPLTMEYEGLTPGQAVVFEGSLYLLEPPSAQNEYLNDSSLVKITLP
jgi:hypothetical protein